MKRINLALQGGGTHGAFAWGVLDRLMEDGRIEIEGISATSAGAMNAAAYAHGFAEGGREGARAALERFWRGVAGQTAAFDGLFPRPDGRVSAGALDASPAWLAFDLVSRLFSPYQFNPANWNPLRGVLEATVDFARVRACTGVKLFLSATNVRTGKVRVFSNAEITADAVLASACLPLLFQAVEIGGEPYWDGGYMGNPAIFPLIYGCESRDVAIVHITPIERPGTPRLAQDILNRIAEISFNSSLMREMRVIAFVSRLIDEGTIPAGRMKRMLIHSIADEALMRDLPVSSKLNPDWAFLTLLRDAGRRRAEHWLAAHFGALGSESTVDFAAYL